MLGITLQCGAIRENGNWKLQITPKEDNSWIFADIQNEIASGKLANFTIGPTGIEIEIKKTEEGVT